MNMSDMVSCSFVNIAVAGLCLQRRLRASGWYGRASYFVVFDKLQLVGRLETFDPNSQIAGDATRSATAGFNWYFRQHDLKLQVDWVRSRVPGVSKGEQKIIARLQAAF
jgi:phosphate-selective porin